MPTDPIAPVVQALASLVTPNPAAVSGTSKPADWEGSAATQTALFTSLKTLTGPLFAAGDLKTVASGINTALTDVAKVVTTIADNLSKVGSLADVTSAMTALQSGLALAQTLAPGASSAVLTSGSALFQQLQSLLSVPGMTIEKASSELAQLAQQLTALAALFA